MRSPLAVTILIAACGGTQPAPSTPSNPGATLAMHDARSSAPASTASDGGPAPATIPAAPGDDAPATEVAAPVDGGAAPVASTTARVATPAPSTAAASGAPGAPGAVVRVGKPGKAARTRRLTVTVHGMGSVRGGVRSTPAGIDCVLTPRSEPGPFSKTCHASFATGDAITLQFVPGGAASLGQFHEGTQWICDGRACTVELVGDATIDVRPISVPPFPPRAP